MKKTVAFLLALAMFASALTSSAVAFPQFSKEFKNVYIADESTPEQQKLAAAIKVAKCNVCHDPKKDAAGKSSKKNRNAYGQALHKFLGKDDKKNVEKIRKALKDVEAMKAEDAKATFGELLKDGKLPVE